MAFHPLRTFQKNRKFWMAAILLVCMCTFVLCTGMQGGDFSGWLLSFFRSSGVQATEMATPYPDMKALKDPDSISTRKVYLKDLDDLKKRRDIANDYMTRANKAVFDNLRSQIKEQKKTSATDVEHKRRLHDLGVLLAAVKEKFSRPRYFRGGTGITDLLDFLLWRAQADRLDIRLTDSAVQDMVAGELYSAGIYRQYTGWGEEASLRIQNYEMRKSYREIMDAVTDEFRVSMARLVLEDSAYAQPFSQSQFNPTLGKAVEPDLSTRNPLSPAMFYDFYKKNRSPAQIVVLPVPVEDFFSKIPEPKDKKEYEKQLERLYEQYKDKKYDPTRPELGFKLPDQVQIQWVSVDPKSPVFTTATRAITLLTQTQTPTAEEYRRFWDPDYKIPDKATQDRRVVQFRPYLYDPTQSPLLAAASYALQQPAQDALLADAYERDRKQNLKVKAEHEIPGLLDYFGLPLLYENLLEKARRWVEKAEREKAVRQKLEGDEKLAVKTLREAQVRLVGACAGCGFPGHYLGGLHYLSGLGAVAAYQDTAVRWSEDELEPVLDAERQKRTPVFAALVLGGATSPFTTLAMADHATRLPQYLPLVGPVAKTYREKFETNLAQERAREIMQDVRERLTTKRVWGDAPTFDTELKRLLNEYNTPDQTLVIHSATGERRVKVLIDNKTARPRNPFDIGDDSGLKPLKRAYERWYEKINIFEGRSGTPDMLKKGDFARLFFGSEKLGVGGLQPYQARAWPPETQAKLSPLDALMKEQDATQPQKVDHFDEAEQAFLFWKLDTKQPEGEKRQGLANPAIRRLVERAWKVQKVRELLFERTQGDKKQEGELDKLVKGLVAAAKEKEGGRGRLQVAFQKAAQLLGKDKEPLLLRDVAPLAMKQGFNKSLGGLQTSYEPYEVPYGMFLYPREDREEKLEGATKLPKQEGTTRQILALLDLKKPLESNDPQLDKLNKQLFESTHKTGRIVQVLTNSPRTEYYLAAMVVPPHEASDLAHGHFFDAYRDGAVCLTQAGDEQPPSDFLIALAYQEFARDYHRELMAQMRVQAKLGEPSKDARTQFPDGK